MISLSFFGFHDIPQMKLNILSLGHNDIADVPLEELQRHANLYTLELGYNKIADIHPELFHGLLELTEPQLGHNSIAEIHPLQFQRIRRLSTLGLEYNRLTSFESEVFDEFLGKLEYLDFSHNNLIKVTLPLDARLVKLKYLSFASNNLSHFQNGMFQNKYRLIIYLDLSENRIKYFNFQLVFTNESQPLVGTIDLRKNNLYLVNSESFKGFKESTYILFDNAATCCFILSSRCTATILLSPFLTCGKLIPNQVQRVSMWILGIFAILSNACVLCHNYRRKQDNSIQIFFISNLSISDLLLGVYMLMIVSADRYYQDYFPSESWRASIPCKITGTLSILSSEASVFFVTLISFDRFMGIKFTFSDYRLSSFSAKVLVLIIWVITIAMSATSTIISSTNPNLYDVSEVCTSLTLSRSNVYVQQSKQKSLGTIGDVRNVFINTTSDEIVGHELGTYFGIAIFTILNYFCFLIIAYSYTVIFFAVIESAKKSGRAIKEKE